MAIAATSDLPTGLASARAAAYRPSSGPDHGPAGAMQNGHIWTALVSIRIQPETIQIGGYTRGCNPLVDHAL
jgi:hypothetical protein